MISVFTASHDTKFLSELEQSLVAQTHTDWEWIVLLNGPAIEQGWERQDPRTIVLESAHTDGYIGALKREAVEHCKGSILVEVDHDDKLFPDALETIHAAFMDHPNATMVYSDWVQINEDGSPNDMRFDPTHGWSYYDYMGYTAAQSFQPHPHNVSHIWYAPNHVRAFTAESYDDAGGYPEEMSVMDDQALMNVLFLNGPFYHIARPLYMQRMHPGNSQRDPERNQRIQELTVKNNLWNIRSAMTAWCERRSFAILNLQDDPSLLDRAKHDSVGLIVAEDVLQRVDKQHFMQRCYDVLVDGGMLLTLTPSTDGRGAWQDPTHTSFWNENSFWYYTDKEFARYADQCDVRFQVNDLTTYFPSEWHEVHDIPYVRANLIAVKSNVRQFGGVLKI